MRHAGAKGQEEEEEVEKNHQEIARAVISKFESIITPQGTEKFNFPACPSGKL